jgi:hypothetical protein
LAKETLSEKNLYISSKALIWKDMKTKLIVLACIVITVPEKDYSMQLIKEMRKSGYAGKIFTSIRNEKNRDLYSNYNIDMVLSPYKMAAANFFEIYLSGLAERKKEQH